MASGNGKRLGALAAKSLIWNETGFPGHGMKVASASSTQVRKGEVMNSVVSITTVSHQGASYVRCPSCQVKVREVHDFIARMTWERFRCKCGYDGPLEYTASVVGSKSKSRGA
jgi:predicted RNA-binding Zn-ribbon protein involved in translation (DUF1610 family)